GKASATGQASARSLPQGKQRRPPPSYENAEASTAGQAPAYRSFEASPAPFLNRRSYAAPSTAQPPSTASPRPPAGEPHQSTPAPQSSAETAPQCSARPPTSPSRPPARYATRQAIRTSVRFEQPDRAAQAQNQPTSGHLLTENAKSP